MKTIKISDVDQSNIINPNWGKIKQIERNMKTITIKGESKLSFIVEDNNDYNDDNKTYSFDPVKSKRKETYIIHDNGVMIYAGMGRASTSYEIMMDFALNKLMFKQDFLKRAKIKKMDREGNEIETCYPLGYIYIDKKAIDFIIDYFDKRIKINSYLIRDRKSKRTKIKSELKKMIEYGAINKVYYLSRKDNEVYEVENLYSLNIFDCYSGYQVDKISYKVIKHEKNEFVEYNPTFDYSNYINNEKYVFNDKISIFNFEKISDFLRLFIEAYSEELINDLSKLNPCGLKVKIKDIAEKLNMKYPNAEYHINKHIKLKDIIMYPNRAIGLNPDRYCV